MLQPVDLWEMAEGFDWRHRRLMGALAIVTGRLVRAWATDVKPWYEENLRDHLEAYGPED